MLQAEVSTEYRTVNTAFSTQSSHFDDDDFCNDILQEWRERIYSHVDTFIKADSYILELNAGTGIDAMRFVNQGHHVHATDLSDGMIQKINKKIEQHSLYNKLTCQQISFDKINEVKEQFDYVFSNFGGLNCINDLKKVTIHLKSILNKNAFVTFVIMPSYCPWEMLWLLKGDFKKTLRRWNKKGVVAHLEGFYFNTYYHSLSKVKKAFDNSFSFVKVESIGVVSPPPSAHSFVNKFPKLTRVLKAIDKRIGKFPFFNRWGDHIIVTFRFN
ncbi:MAG: hypothetical protein OJF59_002751 [Cytophagales bacterium]|jgi:ubiquinone/menaquinone biosynthesis C-methylase UbiE|nr:methyltransferase domain-containing protein [Bacteroidota bacterium]WHZ08997.1 MAG: hypothetical protein OJF59_002751 [Cytophagales bacterium]